MKDKNNKVEFAKENSLRNTQIPEGKFEHEAQFKQDIKSGHRGINNNSAFNREIRSVEFGKDNDFCEDCKGCNEMKKYE